MQFEWDEAKRAKVLDEHGLDFADVVRAFEGPRIEDFDSSHSQTEERWRMLGILDGEAIMVVYTERAGTVRLITARKATVEEAQLYFAEFFGEPL